MIEPAAIELADEAKDALLATEDPWMPELPEFLSLSKRHSPVRRGLRMISSLTWGYLRMRMPGIQRTIQPVFWVPHLNSPFHVRVHSIGSGYSKRPGGFDARGLQATLRLIAFSAERFEITHFHSAWIGVRNETPTGEFSYYVRMRAARVPQPRYD